MSPSQTANPRHSTKVVTALRRFAISISVLNVFGYTVLGFEQPWTWPFIALAVAYALDVALEAIGARAEGRAPRFKGNGFKGLAEFLLPAHITALAVNMLSYVNDVIWVMIFGVIVAVATTILATLLGTLAALGLARPNFPAKAYLMGVLISPMVVPVIITAVGMYFFYTQIGLSNSLPGLILAHTALATPFVVLVVTATLSGFDHSLSRAGASLGAGPLRVFTRIILPLILPGVISGALFAFVTSFDEVVVVLFLASPEQRTLPKQMFSGIREMISPTITAAATLLILFSVFLLTTVELLRRRSERLRGIRG